MHIGAQFVNKFEENNNNNNIFLIFIMEIIMCQKLMEKR